MLARRKRDASPFTAVNRLGKRLGGCDPRHLASALFAVLGLSACVSVAERPVIGIDNRVPWPLPDSTFTIYDASSGDLGGTFTVLPGADALHAFAAVLDDKGQPMTDLSEPIPFVLTDYDGAFPDDSGIERAWLIEWGPGPDRSHCQVQTQWPPMCVQALLITLQGEAGFAMPALNIADILAVDGAEAIAEETGGGAGFMPFTPLLVVKDGTEASVLAALIVDALTLAAAGDSEIITLLFVPSSDD